ncbi:hypothetical protein IDG99_01505 [Pelagibacterales bacterium SAG-MED09]|nr:hypothetical protein [Pelagibacterales bacterium SAG-MED09]
MRGFHGDKKSWKLISCLKGEILNVVEGTLSKKFQQVPFDENINCDAKKFIKILKDFLIKKNFKSNENHSKWLNRCVEWKETYDPVKKDFFKNTNTVQPYAFIRRLSEKMDKDDILVADCGGNIVTCNHAFETKKGQRYFTNNGNSPMGFSFSGAIGAYFANPKKRIVCIIGDGGMNMNIQELQTIKNYNINIKTIILNNHIYGITKAFQETNFGGKSEACGPRGYIPPDFIKVSKAYGIKTMEIKNNSEFDEKIDQLLNCKESIVVDVDCHDHHEYEPRIFGWKTPIEDMYPYIDRDEFKKNMIIDPVEGWESPIMPKFIKSDEVGDA